MILCHLINGTSNFEFCYQTRIMSLIFETEKFRNKFQNWKNREPVVNAFQDFKDAHSQIFPISLAHGHINDSVTNWMHRVEWFLLEKIMRKN